MAAAFVEFHRSAAVFTVAARIERRPIAQANTPGVYRGACGLSKIDGDLVGDVGGCAAVHPAVPALIEPIGDDEKTPHTIIPRAGAPGMHQIVGCMMPQES
jgi:hypothetical protein